MRSLEDIMKARYGCYLDANIESSVFFRIIEMAAVAFDFPFLFGTRS